MGFFIGAAEESGVPLLSTQFVRPLLCTVSLSDACALNFGHASLTAMEQICEHVCSWNYHSN